MAENNEKLNRQVLRSITALQAALLDLMKQQLFEKITITDLARRSGLTRSTFYAHFETKDQLLESIINRVLDEFFDQLWDFYGQDSEAIMVLESNKAFFRVWEKHRDLIPVLESMDFGCLMVARLREYWEKLYHNNVHSALPDIGGNYSAYTLNFLAFSFAGFLKEWVRQDMKPSPEIMGEMLYHFTGHETMIAARQKFKDKFE